MSSTRVPAQLPDDHFKVWISCSDGHYEQEFGSPKLHTHLAFDFHGVAISAPERLRLVKTPIHFPGCSFCTTPPKKFSTPLPTKSGALVPDDPL